MVYINSVDGTLISLCNHCCSKAGGIGILRSSLSFVIYHSTTNSDVREYMGTCNHFGIYWKLIMSIGNSQNCDWYVFRGWVVLRIYFALKKMGLWWRRYTFSEIEVARPRFESRTPLLHKLRAYLHYFHSNAMHNNLVLKHNRSSLLYLVSSWFSIYDIFAFQHLHSISRRVTDEVQTGNARLVHIVNSGRFYNGVAILVGVSFLFTPGGQ